MPTDAARLEVLVGASGDSQENSENPDEDCSWNSGKPWEMKTGESLWRSDVQECEKNSCKDDDENG